MTAAGTTTFTYDGDGLRVQKSNSKLRWRAPGGGPFITTTDASGGTVKDMIYFAGHLVAERVATSGNVNYYFGDQVGSSRLVVNSTGTPCWDADYYPFGGANVLTMTNCQPVYKYAGMESDSETSADMDYAMYRYYDHRFARFMSPDPLSGFASNPQSWNRYAYVIANPLGFTDPLGLVTCPPCKQGGGNTGGGDTGGGTAGSDGGHDAGAGQSPNAHVTRYRVTEDAPSLNCTPGQKDCVTPKNCTPGTKGCYNVPTKQQRCLIDFYNSGLGKAVEFGSPLSLLPGWNPQWKINLGEWTIAIVGKGGGVLGSGAVTGTTELTTISGTTTVGSTLELGAEVALGAVEKAAIPLGVAATSYDIFAHMGCAFGNPYDLGDE